MPEDTPQIPRRKSADSAAVSVRLLTLDAIDGRTLAARQAKDLIGSLSADLGGVEHLTTAQRQLVQRVAILGAYVEDIEARWLAGEPIELDDYLTAVNTQRRILTTIGLRRVARDITQPMPTLAQILAEPD